MHAKVGMEEGASIAQLLLPIMATTHENHAPTLGRTAAVERHAPVSGVEDRGSPTSGRRRWLVVALITSVLVHVLILLVPVGGKEAEPPQHAAGSRIRLAPAPEIAPQTSDGSDAGEERIADAGASPEKPRPAREPRPSEAESTGGAPLREPATAERPPEPGTQERKADVTLKDRDPRASDSAEADPIEPAPDAVAEEDGDSAADLFPAELMAELAGRSAAAERSSPEPGETLTDPPAARSPAQRGDEAERRIASMVREDKARHRVETGLVDPYFVRLRESFEQEMEPTWEHFDEDAEDGLLADLGAWLRDYRETSVRYAETGSPYREGEGSGVGPHDSLGGPPAPSGTLAPKDSRLDMAQAGMQHQLFRDMASGRAGGVEVVAVLRVVQSANGRLLRVEIERSSGKPIYDELARSTVRRSLSKAGPPERAGTGMGLTSERIESLWAFRTRFVVVPLMPMVGCEIESDGAAGECVRPLQRRVLHNVDIEAVF